MSAGSGSTTYGPLVVSQAAFGPALPALSGSWVAQPDMAAFPDGEPRPGVGERRRAGPVAAGRGFLNGAQLITSLPSVLAGAASNLTVARSPLVISALELLVLAIAALVAVARLLAAQREGETALLIARGATRAQLTWLTAAEVIPLSALVSVAGGLAGDPAGRRAGSAGPLGTAGIRLAGRPGTSPDALGAAVAVAAIAAAVAARSGARRRPGAAGPRRQAGRGGGGGAGRP